jgi:hypothetical protein
VRGFPTGYWERQTKQWSKEKQQIINYQILHRKLTATWTVQYLTPVSKQNSFRIRLVTQPYFREFLAQAVVSSLTPRFY